MMQVQKAPKPVASCAMPAAPNMVVKTETPVVRKAREGVMEFLLVSLVVALVLRSCLAQHAARTEACWPVAMASGLC